MQFLLLDANPIRVKKNAARLAPGGMFNAWNRDQSKTGLSTPRILCSFGEVVVYCMWIFLSGKM